MSLNNRYHLRLTEAFINERPVDVILMRPVVVEDFSGGYVSSGSSPLPSQTVRKVASPFVRDAAARVITDGDQNRPSFTLIGMPDVDILKDDTFEIDGVWHRVTSVSRIPEWRVAADVVEELANA